MKLGGVDHAGLDVSKVKMMRTGSSDVWQRKLKKFDRQDVGRRPGRIVSERIWGVFVCPMKMLRIGMNGDRESRGPGWKTALNTVCVCGLHTHTYTLNFVRVVTDHLKISTSCALMSLWALLWVGLSERSHMCHLRACSHMMRVNDITWTAGAATTTVTAVGRWCLRCRTITTQQCIHCISSYGTITWHWMACSHPTSQLCRLAHRLHFEAVYIQVITHLTTHFHRKVQKVHTAEYLQVHPSGYLQRVCKYNPCNAAVSERLQDQMNSNNNNSAEWIHLSK